MLWVPERHRFRHHKDRGLKVQAGQPEDAGFSLSFDSVTPMLPPQIPQPQEGTMVAQGCPVIVNGNSEAVGPGWAEVLSGEVFSAGRKTSCRVGTQMGPHAPNLCPVQIWGLLPT